MTSGIETAGKRGSAGITRLSAWWAALWVHGVSLLCVVGIVGIIAWMFVQATGR